MHTGDFCNQHRCTLGLLYGFVWGALDLMYTAVGKEIVDLWSSQGATVGWIGVDKVAVGVYGVADQLRTEAIEAVRNLKVSFISHLKLSSLPGTCVVSLVMMCSTPFLHQYDLSTRSRAPTLR